MGIGEDTREDASPTRKQGWEKRGGRIAFCTWSRKKKKEGNMAHKDKSPKEKAVNRLCRNPRGAKTRRLYVESS